MQTNNDDAPVSGTTNMVPDRSMDPKRQVGTMCSTCGSTMHATPQSAGPSAGGAV